MRWVKFKIKTITEAEDIIVSTLNCSGEGADVCGHSAGRARG